MAKQIRGSITKITTLTETTHDNELQGAALSRAPIIEFGGLEAAAP